MADLVWEKGYQFDDDDGNPLNAGLLYIYDAGTTSERTVYQDDDATTPWTQPITLNSAGRLTASVYIPTGDWKFLLTDSGGSTVATEDDIPGAVSIPSATYALPRTTIVTKATNYSIASADLGKKFEVDATGGDVTITLIAAASATAGDNLWIQNVGATGQVIIDGNGSETINGATTLTLYSQYEWVMLQTDGANWKAFYDIPSATLTKTAAYTVTTADRGANIQADTTSAAFTITLPPATDCGDGFRLSVQKIDAAANAVTIDGNSAETIDGSTTITLQVQWESVELMCDGSNWTAVSHGYLGARRTGTIISPTQLTADTNDYAPTNFATAEILQVDIDAARSITGLAGGITGRRVIIVNISSSVLTLTSQDAGSSATNRFSFNRNVVLNPSCALSLYYTGSRWRAESDPVTIATQAVMEAGTSGTYFVTPSVQHYHPGHPKMWGFVTVSGGTPTLQTSYNITSIADTAAGRMTVTIATDFSSANWACIGSTERNTGWFTVEAASQAAGSFIARCTDENGSLADPTAWAFMGLGDQ